MNNNTRILIRDLAEKLIKKISNGSLTFPIDVERIIKRLGGVIDEELNEPFVDAEISRSGESFIVKIKPSLHENRKRFTLAHELAHLFLHMKFLDNQNWNSALPYKDGAFRRTEGDYHEEELQAHEFAASFLMPQENFIEIAHANLSEDGSYYRIDEIAKHFGVSIDAATNRGRWLGIFKW